MEQGLNTLQLRHALTENAETEPCFRGIYPCDYLKNLNGQSTPELIIVNTDPSDKPGKHWLLFFFDRQTKTMEMFDSLGRTVEQYSQSIQDYVAVRALKIKYVTERMQPPNSPLCGHYCLYYAYVRCSGQYMENIIKEMPSAEWIKNCVPILFDIPGIISECQCCENL